MDLAQITRGLNEQQAAAVAATRGPVCILAGAGSGKTTTITRRIAAQVVTETFDPERILAVTFTNRAAGELKRRLGSLGAPGVNARTFHSAALQQLRFFAPEMCGEILAAKGRLLYRLVRSLPKPYNFKQTADIATEIEWAKNKRIDPKGYRSSLGAHKPPIPADLMAGLYERYEAIKAQNSLMDFEDVLERTIAMFARDEYARERFRAKYTSFTVDEYQDVNLLQQALLEQWLGQRDDLCVVGDDYQSIYSFTGADPKFLLEMPARYPRTQVFRLEKNYRSSPEILEVANRLVPKLGGAEKTLVSVQDPGEAPARKGFHDREGERAFITNRIGELHREGVPHEEMAILYRINSASEELEDALSTAGIPYQVQGGAFLRRPAARSLLPRLKRAAKRTDIAEAVKEAARAEGYEPTEDPDAGQEEIARRRDLERFIALAEEFEGSSVTVAELIADLGARFGAEASGRGVHLLTLHRAKGLEWDAVFLPALEDGELPFKRAGDAGLAEERRLFYVGLTRARRYLHVTWTRTRRKPSAFVGEISPQRGAANGQRREARPGHKAALGQTISVAGGFTGKVVELGDETATISIPGGSRLKVAYGDEVTVGGKRAPLEPPPQAAEELLDALKSWRLERARADEVPAYVILHDTALSRIAEERPATEDDLLSVPGMGAVKLERYGPAILEIVAAH